MESLRGSTLENYYWRHLIENTIVILRQSGKYESAEVLENAEYSLKVDTYSLGGSGFHFVSVDFALDLDLYSMVKWDRDKISREILSTLVLLHTDNRNVKIISVNIVKKA